MEQITRKKLGNGVGLTCVTTPKFKHAILRAALLLPLGGEDAACRAALPQVLRRGTKTLPDLNAIGACLDELYGARLITTVHKMGETLVLEFVVDVIDERYAAGADGLTARTAALLGEMIYAPYLQDGAFCPDYTASERDNLLDRIAAQKNDPRTWAPTRLIELMCEGERFGESRFGTAEQAKAIGEKKLHAAYLRALAQAQIELFYCGSMEADLVQQLFAAHFPARSGGENLYVPHCEVLAAPKDEVRTIEEKEQVTQGKLSLGFRTGGNCMTAGDPLAYTMFQTVFGGSTSSKLFLNVREKMSLCYYASAQVHSLKGVMIVNSGIENKNYDVAREEILRQLEACRAGDIADAEIAGAKKTVTGAWRAIMDDPMQLDVYWLMQAVAGTMQSPEERIAGLENVTRERIVACAQQTALDTVYFMKGAAQ